VPTTLTEKGNSGEPILEKDLLVPPALAYGVSPFAAVAIGSADGYARIAVVHHLVQLFPAAMPNGRVILAPAS
jgi:hypothetical protein